MSDMTTIAEWHERMNQYQYEGAIIYSSSGSTGPSKSLPYTPSVFRGAVERTKEVCAPVPIQKGDKIVIMWGYGLFPPAQFYTHALSELGSCVYPLGSGKNLATELKIARMIEVPPQGIVGMPSYLLKVGHDMTEAGSLASACEALRYIITGGEVLDTALREALERLYRVPVFDHYGMLQAPMIAGECQYGHNHISADYTPEVLLADGTIAQSGKGMLLLSSDVVWPIPLMRLQTNDYCELTAERCECGTRTPWARIHGRTDHIIKIRGQQIDFPLICASLRSHGLEDYYFEVVKGEVDTITLHIDAQQRVNDVQSLLTSFIAVSYEVKQHDELVMPLTNTGKVTQVVIRSRAS
jgi:phenylacetate-CoA ligase